MREHGVLDRILLIYEEISSRIENGHSFSVRSLQQPAKTYQALGDAFEDKEESLFGKGGFGHIVE